MMMTAKTANNLVVRVFLHRGNDGPFSLLDEDEKKGLSEPEKYRRFEQWRVKESGGHRYWLLELDRLPGNLPGIFDDMISHVEIKENFPSTPERTIAPYELGSATGELSPDNREGVDGYYLVVEGSSYDHCRALRSGVRDGTLEPQGSFEAERAEQGFKAQVSKLSEYRDKVRAGGMMLKRRKVLEALDNILNG
ncbi:MAG: hypothetical protein HKM24_04535 [Gammaproteobacteria bacterium]|nr:hypothetical protein [Gammaproteobacteria bacterium]